MQRVEYSLDASRWRIVHPKDGIPDSRREEFEVVLEESEAGRNVIIRATDAMNNVATAVAAEITSGDSDPRCEAELVRPATSGACRVEPSHDEVDGAPGLAPTELRGLELRPRVEIAASSFGADRARGRRSFGRAPRAPRHPPFAGHDRRQRQHQSSP